MKILQINTVYKNGGSTGRIVFDLKQTIGKNGNEAFVAFGYEYSKTDDENTYMMERIPELKLSILQTRLFAEHGFYNQSQTKKLLKWIDTIKPDVIHIHNLHNHYMNVELLFDYIKEHNIPVVWTLHDCWSFTGWCAYFDYADCDKWKTVCHDCPNIHGYPYTWFFDKSKKNYGRKKKCFCGVENLTIVTPCEWLKMLVQESYLNNYPVKVINNGIDIDIFKPTSSDFRRNHGLEYKKMILAVMMSASKRKGIDIIYDLANKINIDEEAIVIVGLKEDEIVKLPQGTMGITRTSNVKELAEIYSAADVFINPTLEDNFPTTNLEALACGTPLATFYTGGSPESVDEHTGIVAAEKNADVLLEAIRAIYSNGKEYYSYYCRKKAEELYSKELFAAKYMKLYREISK